MSPSRISLLLFFQGILFSLVISGCATNDESLNEVFGESYCNSVRAENSFLETQFLEESSYELKSLYEMQKEILRNDLEILLNNGKLTIPEWELIEELYVFSSSTLDEAFKIVENNTYNKVGDILDRLIKENELSPYFHESVVERGEKLARLPNQSASFILENKECFESWELSMAEFSIEQAQKGVSNWNDKQTGIDFASIIIK